MRLTIVHLMTGCLLAPAFLAPAAPAQVLNPLTFDTFAYGQAWSANPGQFNPGLGAALVQPSPNQIWQKVVWAAQPGWPLVDYKAENITTTSAGGPSRLVLSVTPPTGPGLPAGGAEILSDWNRRVFGFGSYRARVKASAPTPTGIGVCNAFYFINSQCELDIEFLSDKQAKPAGTGQVDIVVHDYSYLANNRISVHRIVLLDFDPTLDFHVFGFDWTPGQCDFYVDDVLVTSVKTNDLGRINIGGNVHNLPITLPTAANILPSAMRLSNWTDLPGWCGVAPAVKTDFEVDWVSYSPYCFSTTATKVSVTKGGTANLHLDAGPSQAGTVSAIFGSLRETDLGFNFFFQPNVHMPFEFDWVFTPLLLGLANTANFPGFISVLDAQGKSLAGFGLLPNQIDPSAIGTQFYFSFINLGAVQGDIRGSSNRIRIGLGL